ncbi:hypothetical protein [Sporosarcina newyorkensis]|uniref:hypothetical protein n=1 Tax=Sporosarcina newyorkensis TaxID=759851 RepID=UPI003D02CFF6
MIRQHVCPKRKRLIRLMNNEMKIIISSPSAEVKKFRFGLLAMLGEELRRLNAGEKTSRAERVS